MTWCDMNMLCYDMFLYDALHDMFLSDYTKPGFLGRGSCQEVDRARRSSTPPPASPM